MAAIGIGAAAVLDRAQRGLKVADFSAAGFGEVGTKLAQKNKEARVALFDLSGAVRARVLLATREAVKDQVTADPDMCESVKRSICRVVDLLWDDITIYLEATFTDAKSAYLGHMTTEYNKLSVAGEAPTRCGPGWWRAKLMYTLCPFDRSWFGQLYRPMYWIITLVALIPYGGIRVLIYTIVLLCHVGQHEPPDEYQLVAFILTFKGSQFLSSGVALAVAAAVQFYICVNPDGTHTCDVNGPGASTTVPTSLLDVVGSCVLVWAAFLCLPCSERNAGVREIVLQQDSDASGPETEVREPKPQERKGFCARLFACCCFCGCCGRAGRNPARGGRLARLLSYDLLAFFLSALLLGAMVYGNAANLRPDGAPLQLEPTEQRFLGVLGNWQFRTSIFLARVFYAFLALPFLPFYLPGLSGILTHTTPTGYNPNGKCVPFCFRPEPPATPQE